MYASKAIIYIFINVGDLQLSDTNLQIVLKLNNTLPNVLLGDFWSQNPAPPHNCKSHLLMLLQEETAAEWGHLPHVSHICIWITLWEICCDWPEDVIIIKISIVLMYEFVVSPQVEQHTFSSLACHACEYAHNIT